MINESTEFRVAEKNLFNLESFADCCAEGTKGKVQKYLLCNLVDFSIKWWVGSRKSIKVIEAIFSI